MDAELFSESEVLPIEVLQSFCPDEKSTNTLSKIAARLPYVREIEFDDLMRSVESTKPENIPSSTVQKSLSAAYVEYLSKTFPNWRKLKEILHRYPGIAEDWQLVDPYHSVMSYINRPDAQETTTKGEFNVALIFPRSFEERASVLSQAGKDYLGFEELYVALQDAGYPTHIYNAEQKGYDIPTIVDQIITSKTRAVGINLTAMTAKDGLKLAQHIKEADPSIKIFLGGHHISLAVQEDDIFSLSGFDSIDGIVVGKGDLSFPLAIDSLRRNGHVALLPDVVLRDNPDKSNIVNAWRAIPLSKYPTISHIQLEDIYSSPNQHEVRSARMSTSEGCIGNCSYCTSVSLYDRHYSPRSIKQVVDEIEFLQRHFGVNSIFFNDDIFIKPGKDGLNRANEFCDELERRNININFRPLIRPDSIPFTEEGDELFRRLKRNGMVMAFVGFESASTNMLDLVDKLVDVSNYKKFVERAVREQVALQLGFIAWHPLMNMEDVHQNFQFLYETEELYNFSVMVQKLDIFPGTRDKRRLIEAGLLFPGFNCLSDPQNYYFQDREIGKLAGALNQVYRTDERFEKFDKAVSKLHLTVIPDLLNEAERLLREKPSDTLSNSIRLLRDVHREAIHSINDLLYTFIQDHLESYGKNVNLNEAIQALFDQLLPQLYAHLQAMTDVIEYVTSTSLRDEGKFESYVNTLFPWSQFSKRIDRNIALQDNGISEVLHSLINAGLHFNVITDHSTINAVITIYPELQSILNEHSVLIADEYTHLESDTQSELQIDCIVGLGGGTALDLAKRLSNKVDLPMVLLPTILSTNTFSSPVIHPVLQNDENDFTPSMKGRMPDFVLIDPLFLSKQDKKLNALGFGDIIASYSARIDWKKAVSVGQSEFNSAVDYEVQNIFHALSQPIDVENPQGIVQLAKLLTNLSYCTVIDNIGSNPASGSEKIFSTAALQHLGHTIYHGNMMLLGTLIMTYLQGRDVQYLMKILKTTGFKFSLRDLDLNRNKLSEILIDAKRVSQRKGRKTILDDFDFSQEEITHLIDSMLATGLFTE